MSDHKNLVLKASKITKIYSGKKVLSDINITISKGEIITIIGPNGGGKSTLAKILVGILKPTTGTISQTKNIRIGYMPQKLSINSTIPLTVQNFLELQINHKVDKVELTEIAKHVNIEKILQSSMHEISGGESQRVLLAHALLSNPDLLILDEPEQNVDINGQAEIYSILHKINKKRNIAMVIISHDLYLVMSSSSHVICLNQHICCEGKPETLTKDKAYIDLFGNEISNDLALYPHKHDHKHDICEH